MPNPTPTPTQEEKDRALEYAHHRADGRPVPNANPVTNLARCHLHATAELARAEESSPADLRAAGWSVAVHNDYRLNGEPHTFWLFTKDGRALKGEGRNDAEALNAIRQELASGEEETNMEPKFTPKPGDRVRLVSSPNSGDAGWVGTTMTLVRVCEGPYPWRCRPDECESMEIGIVRDAVFAPAPSPSPDAGLEAVKAEVEELASACMVSSAANKALNARVTELELQGRVSKRIHEEFFTVGVAETTFGELWSRIEREERERAGK